MNLGLFTPEYVILGTAVLLLFLAVLVPRRPVIFNSISVLGVILAMFLTMVSVGRAGTLGMLQVTPLSRIFDLMFLAATLLVVLMSLDYFDGREVGGELYFFLLMALLAMMVLAKARHLVAAFLALELLSFSLFVLVALLKEEGALRAALKFFFSGAYSSSFFLMGMALLLISSGSLYLDRFLFGHHLPLTLVGLAFLLVGFGFKLVYVPFHLWTPDVFQGAPTPVVAFVATAPKVAGFALLLQVLARALVPLAGHWMPILVGLAVLTMLTGNLAALRETDVKRILAFSTIAHAGYLLLAFGVNTTRAYQSLTLYLLAYVFMTVGAFAGLAYLQERTRLEQLRGLARRDPWLALFLSLFFVALAGIPPTAGFAAKFYLLGSVVQAGHPGLALFAFLNGVVSAYYYLRVPASMYMYEATEQTATVPGGRRYSLLGTVMWVSVILVLYLGIYPHTFLEVIRQVF